MDNKLIDKLKSIAKEEVKKYKTLSNSQQFWLNKIVVEAHKRERRPIPKWWWVLAVGHLSLENETPPFLYNTPKICLPGEKYERVGRRIIFRFNNNQEKYGLGKYDISLGLEIGHIAIYGQGDFFKEVINPL